MEKTKPVAGKGQTGFENSLTSKSKINPVNNRITPNSCPKYEKCSANICPLGSDWQLRTHRNGEPTCFYLREYVKQGGIAKLRGYIPKEMLEQIAEVLPDIMLRYVDIKNRLKRSGKTSSKIVVLKNQGGLSCE